MSLIRNIDRRPLNQGLIGGIINLCKGLHIDVVAEGVETGAERDELRRLGCELFQGYLFAKPGRPFPMVTLS
jgi:EAL domain-containing protein (putative c-di-GMP-specific phosphodiesterase class I)